MEIVLDGKLLHMLCGLELNFCVSTLSTIPLHSLVVALYVHAGFYFIPSVHATA